MRPILALILSLLPLTGAAAADPITGLWRTDAGQTGTEGLVRVSPCGPAFCAVIEGAADGKGTAAQAWLLGRRVFWGMEPKGGGLYEGGRVWSPAEDKDYVGRVTLKGDRLVIEGCVLALCRVGGRWQRAD